MHNKHIRHRLSSVVGEKLPENRVVNTVMARMVTAVNRQLRVCHYVRPAIAGSGRAGSGLGGTTILGAALHTVRVTCPLITMNVCHDTMSDNTDTCKRQTAGFYEVLF